MMCVVCTIVCVGFLIYLRRLYFCVFFCRRCLSRLLNWWPCLCLVGADFSGFPVSWVLVLGHLWGLRRLVSVGSLVPYRWVGVGHVEGGLLGSAGAGCSSWLVLVYLMSVWLVGYNMDANTSPFSFLSKYVAYYSTHSSTANSKTLQHGPHNNI